MTRSGSASRTRFPSSCRRSDRPTSLGIVAAPTVQSVPMRSQRRSAACSIRQRARCAIQQTGERRPISPRDIGILFRTKDSHRDFEKALERRQIPSYVYKGLGFFEADEIKDVLALASISGGTGLESARRGLSAVPVRAPVRSRAAGSAPRIWRRRCPAPGTRCSMRSTAEDRLVLERTRQSLARWLSLVDRLPPAEIARDWCSTRPRTCSKRAGLALRQARENLKKIRAMIRRVQNRGYATMSRLAEHLERLTAGDESNAVIDAGDSVSLMTIHAAKGLEFPVVFVVNLSKGTGGRRSAIRVVSNAENGQAWLSVGDFQSEADEDAKAKEREETKRLLVRRADPCARPAVPRIRGERRKVESLRRQPGRCAACGRCAPGSRRRACHRRRRSRNGRLRRGRRMCFAFVQMRSDTIFRCRGWASKPVRRRRRPCPDNFGPLADPFAVAARRGDGSAVRCRHSKIATSESDRRAGSRSLAGTLVHRLFERFGIDARASVRRDVDN